MNFICGEGGGEAVRGRHRSDEMLVADGDVEGGAAARDVEPSGGSRYKYEGSSW